ncbi:MAG: hypothetical protein LQ342_006518 [Letrouitia transgressa]|nr:MAG: hypothetical protein LQ342_006518 [Letrouitia transgressa]
MLLSSLCVFVVRSYVIGARPITDQSVSGFWAKVTQRLELHPREVLTPLKHYSRAENESLVIPNPVPLTGQQTQELNSTEILGNDTHQASGLITNNPETLSRVDCFDLSTGRDNKCWKELKLTEWVQEWWETHYCYADEGFAECFLRQEGFPSLDCTGIKPGACVAPMSDGLNRKPYLFYVVYNIYAINQFFLSWWQAVEAASNIAVNNVDEIVQLLDPLDETNLIVGDIMIALTALFAVLPPIIDHFADKFDQFAGRWREAADVMQGAMFVEPQIARYLFPQDSGHSQVVQMAFLHSDLGDIIQRIQNNLNMTVSSIMSNTSLFLTFASLGNFSANPPSLPTQTNYLLYGFNTYLISQALNGNDIHGTFAPGTNPQALATNGTTLNYPIACNEYNEQNVCDSWWYSERHKSAFGLDHFNHMERGYGDVLTHLLTNYTTGELLFDNALACNSAGDYGKPINVTVTRSGVDTACLSQLKIATWNMDCTGPLDHECEFLNQKAQNMFLGNCGSQSAHNMMDSPVYCVPNGYLGPLITQDKYRLKR